jgi:hypothetical protein
VAAHSPVMTAQITSAAAAARETARTTSGKFGTQPLSEAGLELPVPSSPAPMESLLGDPATDYRAVPGRIPSPGRHRVFSTELDGFDYEDEHGDLVEYGYLEGDPVRSGLDVYDEADTYLGEDTSADPEDYGIGARGQSYADAKGDPYAAWRLDRDRYARQRAHAARSFLEHAGVEIVEDRPGTVEFTHPGHITRYGSSGKARYDSYGLCGGIQDPVNWRKETDEQTAQRLGTTAEAVQVLKVSLYAGPRTPSVTDDELDAVEATTVTPDDDHGRLIIADALAQARAEGLAEEVERFESVDADSRWFLLRGLVEETRAAARERLRSR